MQIIMKTKIYPYLAVLLIVLLSGYLLLGAVIQERIIEKTLLYMGTIVEIKISSTRAWEVGPAKKAMEKAFNEIKRVENVFSVYKEDSEVSNINRLKTGETLKISDEAFKLIKEAVEHNKKTDGAFDITVKPLVDLWKNCNADARIPARDEVNRVLASVGSQGIVLDDANKTISFNKDGMAIDLGGIAKGYATDRAVSVLKENGVKNAIVNCGGDMYCLGRRSKKEPWKVGVQHPRSKDLLIFKLFLEDKAIDTSGDYQKYFLFGGKRYSHIINPRTGYPVGDKVVSATAIAKDSTTADIWATALCILGSNGLVALEQYNDIDAIVITKEGGLLKVAMTRDFERKYDITEK